MSLQVGDLSTICLRLRNNAPEPWEQFVNHFEVYTLNVLNDLASADQTSVLNAQGQAQQCKALLRVFSECDQELRSKKPTPR